MTARPFTTWTVLCLLLLAPVTFWARCTAFRTVFPPSGEVELVPTDSHFYVRFARLQLHAFPHLTDRDPYINHPDGAQLYVPLPHGLLVAAFIAAAGEANAERAAAWVGPVVGTFEWALWAALAVLVLGARTGLFAAALVSLAPAVIEASALGNADHHVHEPMFAAALLLGAIHVVRRSSAAWALGAVLGLARWFTPTGFLFIPLTALALLGGRDGRASLRAGAAAAVTLAFGSVVFGRPLSLAYEQFSAFHVLLAVASFGGVAGLQLFIARERRPAALVFGITALAAAPLLAEVMRAAAHMGRSDPLLSIVYESEPLWRDPRWALTLFGPLLVVAAPAVAGLVVLARRGAPSGAAALAFVVPLLAISALQARFSPMAAASCAVGLAIVTAGLLPAAGPLRTAVVITLGAVLSPMLLGLLPRPFEPAPRDLLLSRPTLRWMRDHLPPASEDPFGQATPSYGVVTSHLLGHVVPLWAERPTVATMLSQDPTFIAANLRAAKVLAAETDEEAFAAARDTGARYVVVTPTDRILGVGAPSPGSQLLHLLDHGGMASALREASAHFQLIYDSVEQRQRPEGGSAARVFEVVPGARLTGTAAPGAELSAAVAVPSGLAYRRTARVEAGGQFSLTVAYPGTYEVAVDGAVRRVEVSPDDVRGGKSLVVPH